MTVIVYETKDLSEKNVDPHTRTTSTRASNAQTKTSISLGGKNMAFSGFIDKINENKVGRQIMRLVNFVTNHNPPSVSARPSTNHLLSKKQELKVACQRSITYSLYRGLERLK